jgi:DNA polymerase III alpha subunit
LKIPWDYRLSRTGNAFVSKNWFLKGDADVLRKAMGKKTKDVLIKWNLSSLVRLQPKDIGRQ